MAEKIGLEAVLELGAFSRAVQTYNQAVSGMSKNTSSTASSISSSFVNLGSGILKFSAIAAGVGLAGITALTAGLVLLGSTALTEFAKYERMSLSIQSLVARDLSQGKLVEQQRTVAISLTKKEAQELEGLAGKIHDEELARNTLHARIKEQSESLRQLRDAHGAEALDVQTATARLAELENQYQKSGQEIETLKNRQIELTNTSQGYTTVLEKVRTGQISMTEAMTQAGPKAQELLNWISKLAIQSPFTEEGVNLAFQTALAYGFNIDQAKRLTEAEVDYAAATGKSVDTTNLIALALGQMQAKGKVSGQEIIQLTNAGIGVNKILEDMGFNLDDVSNGLVDSDKFIEAVIKDMEIFDGAAASQANTFSGLISTLSDLKAIGLREFFSGTFTAIQPYLADFVGMLTSAALETGSIRQLGDAFGTYVAEGLEKVTSVITKLTGAFSRFGARGVGVSLLGQLGFSPEAIGQIMSVADQVTEAIDKITGAFERFGLKGAAVSLLGQLGMDPETIGTLRATLGEVSELISGFASRISEFIGNLTFDEIIGGLTGIGAILTGGVFAALVAGLLSLLTPINLIVAGAALLGAAWAGNWYGIRDTLTQVWATVQPVLSDLWTWLSENIPAAIQTVSDIWNNTLKPGFTEIANAVTSQVLPALQNLWDVLTQGTGGTQSLSDLWNTVLLPALKAVGDFLVNTLFPAWVDLEVFLAGALATAIQSLADYWQNWLVPDMQKVKDAVKVMADLWTGTLEPAIITVGDYLNQTLVPLLESLGELFNAVINKALEASAGLWKNVLYPALTKVGNFIKETLSPVFEGVAKTAKDDVSPVLRDLGEVILPILQEGLDYVTEAIKDVIAFFDSLASKVKSFELPPILQPGSPPPMAYAFMDIAKGIDQAALSMKDFNTLMTGLKVTDSSFIDKFVDDVDIGGALRARNVDRNSALGKGISDALKAGLGGFVSNLQGSPELADVTAFVGQIAQQWGRSLSTVAHHVDIPALYKEIKAKFDELWGKLRVDNLANAVGIANNFSGFASSFADMLTSQIETFNKAKEEAAKLGEENTKLTGTLTTQQTQLALLREELKKVTTGAGSNALSIEKISESLAFGERQLAIYRAEQAKMAEGTLDWEKKQLAIDKLTESMDMQQKQLEKLTAASGLDLAVIQKKQQEIAKLTQEIDKNKEAIQKNEQAAAAYRAELQKKAFLALDPTATGQKKLEGELALIETLQNFLKGTDKTISITGQIAGEDVISGNIFNRVEAQIELNKLLKEQAKREAEITKQKEAQQKLDFLTQQINLIKLISDRGLNPANILKGITLGLNAGASDLLAVTNRIVQAMIGQINSDLQIGSPSRVMIRTFEQVMAGAAIGMERGQSLLSDAVRSIPILNGSIPQPVFSQAAGSGISNNTTYNYNFPMTVSTAATAPAVVRQYEIKRSMYAN